MLHRRSSHVILVIVAAVLLLLVGAGSASAAIIWSVDGNHAPANLHGDGDPATADGVYIVQVKNLGTSAEVKPLTVVDRLPPGVTATGVKLLGFSAFTWDCSATSFPATTVTCSNQFLGWVPEEGKQNGFRGAVPTLLIDVNVDATSGKANNDITVFGGDSNPCPGPECTSASTVDPTTFSATQPGFGLTNGEFPADSFDGTIPASAPVRQAGAHPYESRFDLEFNLKQTTDPVLGTYTEPDEHPKTIVTTPPAGFIGNPQATPKCTAAQLDTPTPTGAIDCPAATQVGSIDTVLNNGLGAIAEIASNWFPDGSQDLPVYNMVPPKGAVSDLAFVINGFPVNIVASLDPTNHYAIKTTINAASELFPVRNADLTLWGVPADPVHNPLRYDPNTGTFGVGVGSPEVPFLTLPSQCETPGDTQLTMNSWQQPSVFKSYASTPVTLSGCEKQRFNATVSAQPTTSQAGSPSGLSVDVNVPQNLEASALGTPPVRKTTLTLPEGVAVNPSSAGGLGACSESEIGLGTDNPVGCPDASKLGSVELETPVLEKTVTGSMYLATQDSNPFHALIAFYIVLEDPDRGLLIKLPGKGELNQATGQITATFDETPQQPFSHLRVRLKSGPRSALTTPSACGDYTTTTQLSSWNELLPLVQSSDVMHITSGPGGGPCAAQGFAPSFSAGTVNPQAGGYSPFTMTLSRSDSDQDLSGIFLRMPPGLLGTLKNVAQCPEAQANAGTCGADSLLGHTTEAVGSGSDPFYVQGGQVFLTGPYKGAPFGLSIVVPAVAGPFNLGTVVVRARIVVDPSTAQITVISDPLPTMLQGIPLDVRTVNVTIDRAGFIFNPTNCNSLALTGTILSTKGATAAVSSPFQAANCAALSFKPSFTVSTQGRASKKNGASLDVKVASGPGQANIKAVNVTLPLALSSRLTTLQKACTAAQFESNLAACPAASVVGVASAISPVLAHPLTGPAYIVSHGGAAFPDLEVVLQGEGITLVLDGKTDIKKGITSSDFTTVPDAPISSFELKLPTGPFSVLATNLPAKANYNLCGQKLLMPTTITGQNGAQIKQSTKITATGCPKAKKKATKKKNKRAHKSSHAHAGRRTGR